MSTKVIQKTVIEYTCDKCGKRSKLWSPQVEVSFGYGSSRDGSIMHFCSDKCFKGYSWN